MPEEFQPLTMSSQWATLWLKDVMQLTEIEDELREKWGPRSHPAPIYGIQARTLQRCNAATLHPSTRFKTAPFQSAATLQHCNTATLQRCNAATLQHPHPHPHPHQVSESVFVYGAPDEWLWHTELSRLNKTLQSPGLTNVYWCWGCEHADNMDGASPAAFLDYDKAVEGCTRAQNMGDFFGRKFGNGAPEGMEGVAKVSKPSP